MRPGQENEDGPPIHGNTRLEVFWTAIPAIILVSLCSYAYAVLHDIEKVHADELVVKVHAIQFAWTFEYPQADGRPVVSNQLYLPKDKPVRFDIDSAGRAPRLLGPGLPREDRRRPGHHHQTARDAHQNRHLPRRLRRAVRARPLGHALHRARALARRLRQMARSKRGARRSTPAVAAAVAADSSRRRS